MSKVSTWRLYLRESCNLHIRRRERWGGDEFFTALFWHEPSTTWHTGGHQGLCSSTGTRREVSASTRARSNLLFTNTSRAVTRNFSHVPAYWIILRLFNTFPAAKFRLWSRLFNQLKGFLTKPWAVISSDVFARSGQIFINTCSAVNAVINQSQPRYLMKANQWNAPDISNGTRDDEAERSTSPPCGWL